MKQGQFVALAVGLGVGVLAISLIGLEHLSLAKTEDESISEQLRRKLDPLLQRFGSAAQELSEAKPFLERLDHTSGELTKVVGRLSEVTDALKTLSNLSTLQVIQLQDRGGGGGGPLAALESRAPTGLLPAAYGDDPEGVYLWEVDQLLATLPNVSLLVAGCGQDSVLNLFGPRFERVSLADPSPLHCDHAKEVARSADLRVSAIRPLLEAGSVRERFDVVLLRLEAGQVEATDISPMLSAARELLSEQGVVVVVTTYALEGEGSSWSKANLTDALATASLFITNHFLFAYNTPTHAGSVWMADLERHSYLNVLHQPLLQAFFVQSRSFFSEGHAPAFGVPTIEPSTPKVRDVVFSLLRGGSFKADYQDFLKSRRCLRDAITGAPGREATAFDEVAFHEGNIPEHIQRELEREVPGLRFADARLYGAFGGTGSARDRWRPWERLRQPGEYPVGYRHMCRFMSMIWIRALWKYEHTMRVDDDVCPKKFGSGDPFAQLRREGAVYGYGVLTEEKHRETVHTMQPWLEVYATSRGLKPGAPINAQEMYFTNFFISKTAWWLSEAVQHFLGAVERTGHIYDHRWGDAPIQSATLNFFAAPEEVVLVTVDYTHLSTQNEINNGTEVAFVQEKKRLNALSPVEDQLSEVMGSTFEFTFTNLLAPCIVGNYFQIKGAPFDEEPAATRAMKHEMADRLSLPWKDVDKYTPWELAQAIQFDLNHAEGPLPRDTVVGLDRMAAFVRLALRRERREPENKEYSKEEMVGLSVHACCQTPKAQAEALRHILNTIASRYVAEVVPGEE